MNAVSPQPNATMVDEETWIADFVQGSAEAFAKIYDHHVQRVYGLLTRILGPVEERDDVLQEVFIELARALPSFRNDSRLSTFLYRIAVRVAQRHAGRLRNGLAFSPHEVEVCISSDRGPWEQTHDRQTLVMIYQALNQIDYPKRVAFTLSAIEGFSYPDVGAILGISTEAAKKRSLRARKQLSKILKDLDPTSARAQRNCS